MGQIMTHVDNGTNHDTRRLGSDENETNHDTSRLGSDENGTNYGTQ